MKRKVANTLLPILSVGLIVGVAGCTTSQAGGSSAAKSNSTASNATGSASTASSQSGLLAHVKKTKVLSVALASFPPLEFQDPKTKKWSGVDIDVLTKFAKSLGAKLQVNSMKFSATIQGVQSKRYDLTANIFKTPKRQKALSFSAPLIKYQEGIIVNSKNPKVSAATAKALQGKRIATVRGTAEENFVPKIKGAKDVSFNNVDQSFQALSNGQVAADLQPVMYAQWAAHSNKSLHIKVLGPTPVSVTGQGANAPAGYYGVPKGSYSTRFLKKLNSFLKKEQSNGDLKKILKKYGLTNPSYLKGLG